jgi:type II secretory pathway pseudopilin PulG
MRRYPHARGFSLLELQLALVLAAIFGLAVFSLFRAGLALFQQDRESVGIGEAAMAMDAVSRAIRETSGNPDSVRLWPNTGVALLSALAPDHSYVTTVEGLPAWTGWVALVYDPDRLELRRVDLTSVDDLSSPPRDQGQLLARQVRSFAVDREGDRITVKMSIEANGRILTLQTAVRPRNR